MSKQNDDEEDGSCLIELIALEKEGSADAEQIPSADAQKHQHCHVESAVAQRSDSTHNEGPARVEDACACQEKQEQIEVHAERRLQLDELHAHRRIEKDRYAEDETNPEAIPHVTDHGMHVHAGAVAHLMRNVVLHGWRHCAATPSLDRVVVRGLAAQYFRCGMWISGAWVFSHLGQYLALPLS